MFPVVQFFFQFALRKPPVASRIFIGEAFAGEPVGLREGEDGGHLVRFFERDLGVIGPDFCFHSFAPPRARLRFAVETKGE